jgi:signal transduction histidine kinase
MADRIFGEQVSLLYRPLVPLAVNLINGAIVVALAAPIWPGPALAWGGILALTVAARFFLRRRFQTGRSQRSDREWSRLFALGTGMTGALWGISAATIPMLEEPLYQMVIGLAVAGMSAGAVASLAVHLPSFHAFMIPCMVPSALAFLSIGDAPHRGLGLMVVIYGVAVALIARGSNGSLVETLRLRFENADLADELAVARDIADQASRSNSETLAHLSHEMRTPLNAIGGFAEMMRERVFGPLGHSKYDEYAKDITDSAAHLTNIVEEILLYSRGHTGTLRLDEEIVDVRAEIAVCVQMIRQFAREGHLELRRELAAELPRLRADPVKLRQMLVNLLSNAVKFTPAGGTVTVGAAVEGGAVVLSVADTGIGIDAGDIARVMQPYVQLHSAFVRTRHPGLGLGLPIVKHLAELHGATLQLTSAPGEGTTVTIRFPPERSVAPIAPA